MDFNSLWCEVMIQTHVALHLAPSSSTIYSIDKISASDIGRGHLRAPSTIYTLIYVYRIYKCASGGIGTFKNFQSGVADYCVETSRTRLMSS